MRDACLGEFRPGGDVIRGDGEGELSFSHVSFGFGFVVVGGGGEADVAEGSADVGWRLALLRILAEGMTGSAGAIWVAR